MVSVGITKPSTLFSGEFGFDGFGEGWREAKGDNKKVERASAVKLIFMPNEFRVTLLRNIPNGFVSIVSTSFPAMAQALLTIVDGLCEMLKREK